MVTAELKKMSKPVSGTMVAQVGTISANNDEAIGTIIAVASLLLTIEARVSEIPEEKKQASAPGAGGMGGMY